MDSDYMTYSEAAVLVNLKIGTLYALVAQQRIPHVRLGRRLVRFSRSSLLTWMAEQAISPIGSPNKSV